jgi:hypothetical protein
LEYSRRVATFIGQTVFRHAPRACILNVYALNCFPSNNFHALPGSSGLLTPHVLLAFHGSSAPRSSESSVVYKVPSDTTELPNWPMDKDRLLHHVVRSAASLRISLIGKRDKLPDNEVYDGPRILDFSVHDPITRLEKID